MHGLAGSPGFIHSGSQQATFSSDTYLGKDLLPSLHACWQKLFLWHSGWLTSLRPSEKTVTYLREGPRPPYPGFLLIRSGHTQDNVPFGQLKVNQFGIWIISAKYLHDCHILLTRNKTQVPATLGGVLQKVWFIEGHLSVSTTKFRGQNKKVEQGNLSRMKKKEDGGLLEYRSREGLVATISYTV
jgi:hypothetical protein